jgi:hypothetical protein
MDDKISDNEDDTRKGKIITFPSGQMITTNELGTPYVIGQGTQNRVREVPDLSEEAKEYRAREAFIAGQELVQVIEQGSDLSAMMHSVIKEIGEELANLKWDRQRAAKKGKDASSFTMGRINGLHRLADVLLKRAESMRAEQLDFKSERFRTALSLWMEFVYDAMVKCGLGQQEVDLVFNTMKADMVDWEKKVMEATG